MRDQNVFAACMVDGDPAIVRRSRRGRRRALLLAIAFEAAMLAALLLVPLASPGVLPRRVILIPSPPYRGGTNPGSTAPRTDVHPAGRGHRTHDVYLWQPRSISKLRAGAGSSAGDFSPVEPPLGFDNIGDLAGPSGILGSTGLAIRMNTLPPPPPRQASRRIHSGGEVEEALLIHRVEPHYPALARQMRLEGTVRLHAIIGIAGAVRELEVEGGHPLLARAAREAVLQWRYRPTRLNGEPVEVETTIEVIFELEP